MLAVGGFNGVGDIDHEDSDEYEARVVVVTMGKIVMQMMTRTRTIILVRMMKLEVVVGMIDNGNDVDNEEGPVAAAAAYDTCYSNDDVDDGNNRDGRNDDHRDD